MSRGRLLFLTEHRLDRRENRAASRVSLFKPPGMKKHQSQALHDRTISQDLTLMFLFVFSRTEARGHSKSSR